MASVDELKLMAVRTENRTVVLHFTPQQLTERRKLITDLAIELMKEEDIWKEIRAEHDAKVKPLKEKMSLTAREVHRGFEEKQAELAELMHKEEETIFAAVLAQLLDYVIIEQ